MLSPAAARPNRRPPAPAETKLGIQFLDRILAFSSILFISFLRFLLYLVNLFIRNLSLFIRVYLLGFMGLNYGLALYKVEV